MKMQMQLCALALLAGCTAAQVQSTHATIVADLPTAKQACQVAVTLYGIDKGLAEVAAIADPEAAPIIAAVIMVADPIAAAAQVALNNNADAPTLMSIAAQLRAQADTLATTAAPSIKVVPAS